MVPSDTFYDEIFAPFPAPEAGGCGERRFTGASQDGGKRWA